MYIIAAKVWDMSMKLQANREFSSINELAKDNPNVTGNKSVRLVSKKDNEDEVRQG